jgi:DNA adenine methylase
MIVAGSVLSTIKGKFLLSSYPDTLLTEYINKNDWQFITQKSIKAMSTNLKEQQTKIELITANYEIKENVNTE